MRRSTCAKIVTGSRSNIRAAYATGCEKQHESAAESAGAPEAAPVGHVPRDFEIVINHYQEDPRLVRDCMPDSDERAGHARSAVPRCC